MFSTIVQSMANSHTIAKIQRRMFQEIERLDIPPNEWSSVMRELHTWVGEELSKYPKMQLPSEVEVRTSNIILSSLVELDTYDRTMFMEELKRELLDYAVE